MDRGRGSRHDTRSTMLILKIQCISTAERRDSYSLYNTTLQQYEDVDAHQSTEAFGFSNDTPVR
jgi:hypothetical protein